MAPKVNAARLSSRLDAICRSQLGHFYSSPSRDRVNRRHFGVASVDATAAVGSVDTVFRGLRQCTGLAAGPSFALIVRRQPVAASPMRARRRGWTERSTTNQRTRSDNNGHQTASHGHSGRDQSPDQGRYGRSIPRRRRATASRSWRRLFPDANPSFTNTRRTSRRW